MNDAVIIEPAEAHQASIIWLHGLGSDGHDFEPIVPELGLSPELGVRFIFPNAPMRAVTINGGMVMRSWYDIKDSDLSVARHRPDFDDSATILENWINGEIDGGIPANKIIVAGFSQGGAIALHCGLAFKQKLAGLLILSSYLPFADVLEQDSAQLNKETPILMMHGEYDPVIPIEFSKQSYEVLQNHDYAVEWHRYPMQHAVCAEEIERIGQWLTDQLDV